MFAADIRADRAFSFKKPELLFKGDFKTLEYSANYDVRLDGRRFLMLQSEVERPPPRKIVIVLNWFEELKRLAPAE